MSPEPDRFAGARVPDPGFAGDTGEVAPEVAAALAAYATDERRYADTLAVLQHGRLLVPVVAVADEVAHDDAGLAHEKSSHMAAVLLRGDDGRLALLAFTGTGPLRSWDPSARPVPVPARVAAQAALQDHAAALVVDVAGPTSFVIEDADLRALAAGWTMAGVGGQAGWIRPPEE